MEISVINGPNLQLLGSREPDLYGKDSLAELETKMKLLADQLEGDISLNFFQSNSEGEILDHIAELAERACDGIIINPAAYTHSSIAIKDALSAVNIPAIEVHISNIHKREEFRKKSITAEACAGQISGLGIFGYHCALRAIVNKINNKK